MKYTYSLIRSLNKLPGENIHIGNLFLPTGQIVACDPFTIPAIRPDIQSSLTLDIKVPPGSYPIEVCIPKDDDCIAYAMLCLSDRKAYEWELATCLDDDDAVYPVDSGTGCFMDLSLAETLFKVTHSRPDGAHTFRQNFWEPVMGEIFKNKNESQIPFATFPIREFNNANAIAFSSGCGDGWYGSYFGYGLNNKLVCIVTDFYGIFSGGDF